MPCVVDPSAIVGLLLGGRAAEGVKRAVGDRDMLAPDLVNLETLAAVRRLVASGAISEPRAGEAVDDLESLPLERVLTSRLISDAWSLRHNVNPYDASYVSLARALGCELITADRKLSGAPGLGIGVVVV